MMPPAEKTGQEMKGTGMFSMPNFLYENIPVPFIMRLPIGQYAVIDLGPCAPYSQVFVNNNGQAVFQSGDGTWELWENGAVSAAITPPVGNSQDVTVTGLNNQGQVCANVLQTISAQASGGADANGNPIDINIPIQVTQAFVWSKGTGSAALGTVYITSNQATGDGSGTQGASQPAGPPPSVVYVYNVRGNTATGINDAGTVIGLAFEADQVFGTQNGNPGYVYSGNSWTVQAGVVAQSGGQWQVLGSGTDVGGSPGSVSYPRATNGQFIDCGGPLLPTAINNAGTAIGNYAPVLPNSPSPGPTGSQSTGASRPVSFALNASGAGITPATIPNAKSVAAINDNGDILGIDTSQVPSLWLGGTTKVVAPGSSGVSQINKNLQGIITDTTDTSAYSLWANERPYEPSELSAAGVADPSQMTFSTINEAGTIGGIYVPSGSGGTTQSQASGIASRKQQMTASQGGSPAQSPTPAPQPHAGIFETVDISITVGYGPPAVTRAAVDNALVQLLGNPISTNGDIKIYIYDGVDDSGKQKYWRIQTSSTQDTFINALKFVPYVAYLGHANMGAGFALAANASSLPFVPTSIKSLGDFLSFNQGKAAINWPFLQTEYPNFGATAVAAAQIVTNPQNYTMPGTFRRCPALFELVW